MAVLPSVELVVGVMMPVVGCRLVSWRISGVGRGPFKCCISFRYKVAPGLTAKKAALKKRRR